jgi:glycosyltransferase 2 family protein
VVIVTTLLSIVCLAWVLNGADLPRIWGEIRHMHWAWVTAAALSEVLLYLLQGWRWGLLLRPIQRVPFGQMVRAIYIGMYANEVLPLRAGELIRCFLLSRSSKIPLSVTFASALIERIFDGVWLILCFLVALKIGKLPPFLIKGGYILGVIVVVLAAAISYGMYARKQSINLLFDIQVPAWFNTLIEDLHLIGHSRYLYYSFLVSGLFLFAQMVPIYAVVRAYHLTVPWPASFTLMVLLRLSAVVPQAPGNLGSFQWVTAKTLMLWGLTPALTRRFSLVLWSILTLPLAVVGFVIVLFAGVKMSHLHREATSAAASRPANSAP